MNSGRSRKWRAGSFLAIFLALLLMVNMVIPSKTYAFPTSLEDFVNEALELTGIKDLVDDVAKLLEDTLNGTLPVVEEIPQIVIDKAKETAEEAVAQLSVIMPILQKVAETGDIVRSVLGYLPDFDVDFSLPIPGDLGKDIGARAWAKKDDDILSLCVWLDGPGKSQLVFGISNEDPLGDGNALHFDNPNKITTAFFDITPNGRDYVHARLPLGTDMPTIYAMGYIPWGSKSDQYIKVEIGAMTDTKVNLNFEVSLKATADAEVSIEGEAKASLSVEVSPREAQRLSNLTMIAMNNALKNEVEKGELGPQAAANIIHAAINVFNNYSTDNPGVIGSISLGVDIAGLVGLGVLDTAWPGISASGGLSLEVPLDAAVNIGTTVLAGLLQNAEIISNDIHRISSCVLSGDLSSDTLNEIKVRLQNSWSGDGGANRGVKGIFEDIVDATIGAISQTNIGISLSLDLAGEGSTSGGSDDGTESSFNLFAAEASIPAGEVLVETANEEFIGDTVEGLALFLGNMLSGNVDQDIPDQLDKLDEVVDNLAEGTEFEFNICTPLYVQLTAKITAEPLVEAAKAYLNCLLGLNRAMLQVAKEGSFKPLQNIESYIEGSKDNLLNFIKSISGSTFGLDLGIGASADLGAEVVATVDGGASVYLETNPEMIFFVGSMGEL